MDSHTGGFEMKEIIVLDWTFTPPDYFEEPISIVKDKYEMTIENGKVEARIEAKYFDGEPDLRMKFHESLYSRFLGAQILNKKPFELSKPSMSRIHADGRRNHYIFPESIPLTMTVGPADVIITDPSGKVIRDSRKERTEKRKRLAELVEKHRAQSPVLRSLLNSWSSSINKPDNELVYLYEIRESLSREFGGKKKTLRILKISNKSWDKSWSRLGHLANEEPLKQGRHRGKHVDTLRDATEDELSEARVIAQKLIEKYLEYLDDTQNHNK